MKIRKLRKQYIAEPCLLIEDRMRLVEACDVFLDLFQAICIDRDSAKAEALASKLNRHVPELMRRCPIAEYRPTASQLTEVRQWYMLDEVAEE